LRGVQPDVDPLDEVARDAHVVVLQEDETPAHSLLAAEVDELLDELLPLVVARVRLPGEDELDRAFLVQEQPLQPLGVAQQECRALVGGEAPREPDRERLGAQRLERGFDLLGVGPPAAELIGQARARERDQAFPPALVDPPELDVGDPLDVLPDGLVPRLAQPVRPEIAGEERGHLLGDPGAGVDPVGDALDRHLRERHVGPVRLPHPPRNFAVEPAHAVRPGSGPKRQERHVELLVRILRVPAAVADELVAGKAQLLVEAVEVLFHELRIEDVDPRRHRRMGREDGPRPDEFERLLEREAVPPHGVPDPLEGQEGGVPLVHMADGRLDPQGAEGAQAADAEDDLLLDARLLVSAVELVGDLAIARLVLRRVGVEEVERDASDIHPPDPERDLPLREVHRNEDRLAGVVGFELDRKIVEVVVGVGLLLPPVGVQVLAEVSLLVEQADADERDAQLARRLEVVARENAEASGVDRQAFRQAELHGEVGDPGGRVGAVTGAEPGLPAQVVVQLVIGAAQLGQEAFVPGRQDELLLPDRSQHPHGIVVRIVPEIRVELAEELDGIVVPRPVEVVGELLENRQLPR